MEIRTWHGICVTLSFLSQIMIDQKDNIYHCHMQILIDQKDSRSLNLCILHYMSRRAFPHENENEFVVFVPLLNFKLAPFQFEIADLEWQEMIERRLIKVRV